MVQTVFWMIALSVIALIVIIISTILVLRSVLNPVKGIVNT